MVEAIGPDALTPVEKEVPYYRVRVSTAAERFTAHGITYDLYPGVRVVCSIHIGQRTLFRYLLGSWMGSARFAMEER